MGGPDQPGNRVAVCGTGHDNIHTDLRALCAAGDRAVLSGTRREQALARAGYDAWVAAGRPGTPE
jgi:hypothetical protein